MRSILIMVMLVIAAIAVYNGTIDSAGGTKEAVRDRGGSVNDTIQNLNP